MKKPAAESLTVRGGAYLIILTSVQLCVGYSDLCWQSAGLQISPDYQEMMSEGDQDVLMDNQIYST